MKRFLILDQALARKIEQQNLANAAQQRKKYSSSKNQVSRHSSKRGGQVSMSS